MYFGTKSYLKSNHYHTPKHPLERDYLHGPNFIMGCINNFLWKKKQPIKCFLNVIGNLKLEACV